MANLLGCSCGIFSGVLYTVESLDAFVQVRFRTQAMLARERAARMALKKPLGQFAYKKHHNKRHHLNLASHKKNLGKRGLKQEPEVSPEAEGVRTLSLCRVDLCGVSLVKA